ncbi:MAG TPA: SRPBCC family protein [Steroidobacteraceae bacterium]|jgi:uncharacterized protein YndB with AHSA1/START domain|nr:SRPBCC family protein [Steroidobacteraceae bacterium]
MSTDKIEKQILLRAPLERVWQAVSDSTQFGFWFGVSFDAPFRAGARLSGRITPTRVDPEVARLQAPHEGKKFEFWVERIEPLRSICFRWHPYAVSPDTDYSHEPTTLIVFALRAVGSDTQLTITESGFDRIALERRAAALEANDGGWAHQIRNIEKYLAMQP